MAESFDEFITALPSKLRRLYASGAYKTQEVIEAIFKIEPRKWDAIIHYCKQLETQNVAPPELFSIARDPDGREIVFDVEVPEDYDHGTYVEMVVRKPRGVKTPQGTLKDFSGFKHLNPREYHNPSYYLRKGERFRVRMVVQVGEKATPGDQLMFLARYRSVKPGAQGLFLLMEQHGDKLPQGKFLTNVDSEDHLVRVPVNTSRSSGMGGRWALSQVAIRKEADGSFSAARHEHTRLVGKDTAFFLWEKVE